MFAVWGLPDSNLPSNIELFGHLDFKMQSVSLFLALPHDIKIQHQTNAQIINRYRLP